MIRLRRGGVKAPADWRSTVDAAFPDAAAFWKKARAFEKLVEHGPKRRRGFSRYAPEVLPLNGKGEPDFPPTWRTSAHVRKAIAEMSHGFCAYCQSPVSSSHPGKKGEERPPGQVEHFRPKARFPARAYDWDNYFLVCMGCNTAKGDKWPVGEYVRPDKGSPGRRFTFAEDGSIAARKKDDRQAKNIIEDFDLKRYWLTRHRKGAIKSHLDFVRRLMGYPGLQVEELLMTEPVAFSEAINQSVRRAWSQSRKK